MLKQNILRKDGVIHIGGVSVLDLKRKYGTGLYIYDQKLFKDTANLFLDKFKSNKLKTEIIYASKAASNLYILGIIKELSLNVDVVSGGELYLALKAGIDPKKIHFHGNNKLEEELDLAIKNNIGQIIIDNEYEYELVSKISRKYESLTKVLLRINPDVKTDTHKFIQTSNADSKFGVNIRAEDTLALIEKLKNDPNIILEGFHAHIGSQVVNGGFFKEEADILLNFTKEVEDKLSYKFSKINFGGGFGVSQKKGDDSLDLEKFLADFIRYIEEKIDELNLSIKTVAIEPGRSLINQAGYTLYTISAIKNTLEGLPLVFVDGGMSDNIRPSLYGAKYDGVIANRTQDGRKEKYRVAGKLCESGDILIDEVSLSNPSLGDLLLIPSSGAYTYSMQSHYNKIPNLAVVFVEDGKDYLAVKRESYEDLLLNNLEYKGE